MKNELPKRKPNRLKYYNYSSIGHYFVIILTKNRFNYFGKIKNTEMILNAKGDLAEKYWRAIPNYYPEIYLDEFIIMPNHIHGIIIIENPRESRDTITDADRRRTILSRAVGYFKMSLTKTLRRDLKIKDFAWQRSFYDHVIRNEKSLESIREYIKYNALNWNKDEYFG